MGNIAPFNCKKIILVLCLCMPILSLGKPPSQKERPNIIFILVDDLRWDAMGFTGQYLFLKTPNIDRLRKEGVHFENAFVTHSLCAPSRATFLTGTFSHTHGVITNQEGREFNPEKTPSFPQLFHENGYATAFIGKWHMGTNSKPRQGFDYWCSFRGQGKYYNNVLNINGENIRNDGYITDVLNKYAVEFIMDKANKDKPFLLYLSHKAVHEPFTPNEKYSRIYEDGLIAEPVSWKDDLTGKPRWQRLRPTLEQRRRYRKKEFANVDVINKRTPGSWNPRNGKGRQKNYLRCLSAVDEGLGEIYDVLKKKGILENTIIVFAGDNGFLHGEHGKGDKRLAYEESIRIPLIMRYPPMADPGSTISELVLNADVAPTFLDIAHIPIPEIMQGESMVPLLSGKNIDWRKSFLYTYWPDLIQSIPRIVAVRTQRYLYSTTPDINDMDELYDLKYDPFEMTNLANSPSYADVKAALRNELEKLKEEANYRKIVPRPHPARTDHHRTGLLFQIDFKEHDSRLSPGKFWDGHRVDTVKAGGQFFGKFTKNTGRIVDEAFDIDVASGRIIIACLVQPGTEEGLIATAGSKKNGWALFIENKRPGILITHNSRAQFADAAVEIPSGERAHIVAVIDNYANRLKIYVNGHKAGEGRIFVPLIKFDDNYALSLGNDAGVQVDPGKISNLRFEGLIGYLKIYRDTTPSLLTEILKTGKQLNLTIDDE